MQGDIIPFWEVCQNDRETTETNGYCLGGEEDCGVNPLWALSERDFSDYWDYETRRFAFSE